MTVTGNDLIALGLMPGPHFESALAEANRLALHGAALETFVRAMLTVSAADPAPETAQDFGTLRSFAHSLP